MAGQHRVTFELDEAAFIAACHALWAYRAIGPTGNLVVGGLVALAGAGLLWQGVPGWIGPVLLAGGVLAVGMTLSRDRLWRRYYRSTARYRAAITATFDDSGVGVQSAEAENHLRWAHFRHYAVTPDYLLLIIDQRQFSIIPRAAYPDPASGAAIEDLVSRQLKRLPRRYF